MKIKYVVMFNEAISVLVAMLSIIILVSSYFPLINPSHYNVANQEMEFSFWRYIIGTTLFVVFLYISLKLNRKAISLRKNKDKK
jgi:uncharacterized membrane protein